MQLFFGQYCKKSNKSSYSDIMYAHKHAGDVVPADDYMLFDLLTIGDNILPRDVALAKGQRRIMLTSKHGCKQCRFQSE